jgi:DNA-binding CsgD family transcriptional regulator
LCAGIFLQAGLTRRELEVYARTLLGMTARGIALDLDVKITSIYTFRRRAYERLNISSGYQLMRLLLT